jgi:hypothetical protein
MDLPAGAAPPQTTPTRRDAAQAQQGGAPDAPERSSAIRERLAKEAAPAPALASAPAPAAAKPAPAAPAADGAAGPGFFIAGLLAGVAAVGGGLLGGLLFVSRVRARRRSRRAGGVVRLG